ncbi:MAG: hypothetical protein KF841_00540 [Phycisphaerae bacterium]|nr:hypothetical protein [Phycisphaerae bacterium]
MNIALVTCRKLPDWEIDDRPLKTAFAARGAMTLHPTWDDASFDWTSCDACLIRTTWDYVPRRDEFVEWAQRVDKVTPIFNPPEIVRWNTHKGYLRDLELRGIPTIPTIWLKAGGEDSHWRESMAERGWKRGFLKPVIGSAAHDTLRFDLTPEGTASASQHLQRLASGRPMMLQPYLSRVESEGEYSVILIDGQVSHAVRKFPVPGDYRVQDDHGGKDEPADLDAAVLTLARRIVQTAGDWVSRPVDRPLLYARVDLLRDDEGNFVLTELELVEPSLFLRHGPATADCLADALLKRLEGRKSSGD